MNTKAKEKPKRLGRGLESLLSPIITRPPAEKEENSNPETSSEFPPDKALAISLQQLSVKAVVPNPYQPRGTIEDAELAGLADSIKTTGLVQPVIVRPAGDKYQLIAGERRLRAAILAGLETIPAMVRQAGEEEMLELALIENIHRSDLNPLERAEGYLAYLNRFSITQSEAAERLGEDRSVLANYLRLLELPNEIKEMLTERRLSMGHARALLALTTDEMRINTARQAVARRMSVREVERAVRRKLARSSETSQQQYAKAAHIIDLEQKLSSALGTKVVIETRKGGKRGKIIVDFYSLDEFERITEKMGLATVEEN
jgi:ParB family chromosome partitioning protein